MKTSKFSKVFIVLIMAAVFGAIAVFFCSNKPYAVIAEEVTEEMQTESTGTGENAPETGENAGGEEIPEEENESEKSFDLDAFLAFVQTYANEAGVGDEYAKAVEAIKTAASKKQVTLSTIASVAMLVVVSVYIVYTRAKNAKLNKLLLEVSKTLDAQVKGTNGLIDESNANNATGAETKKEVAEIKKAMAYLLTGLTAFADRFNIGAASKESVKREFNRAAQAIDGDTAINAKENAENGKDDKAL